MAGVEAVGLVLGVLPLLISAIEHYDDVLRPFRRYRKFTLIAQRFHDELETEKTIFCTECQLLLAAVADRHVVLKMLSDRDHPSWKDTTMCEKLDRQLGSLTSACASVITRIEEKLSEIGKKSEEFTAIIPHSKEGKQNADREWRRRIGTKLKFSFSETGLRHAMTDLSHLNKTFLTLSDQAVRLDKQLLRCVTRPRQNQPYGIMDGEFEKFKIIQKAAKLLYEALSRACTTHSEHLARLCLEARCTYPEGQVASGHIRFHLAFNQTRWNGQPTSASPGEESVAAGIASPSKNLTTDKGNNPIFASADSLLWFDVESTIDNDDAMKGGQQRPAADDLIQILKRQKEFFKPADECSPRLKEPHTVSVQDTSEGAEPRVHESERAEQSISELRHTPSNFHINQDFCKHLQTSLRESLAHSTNAYVGILDETTACKHVIYSPTNHVPRHSNDRAVTLAQLIRQISGSAPLGEMPQYQRLSLAKSLALAVLQFHRTPWLAGSWRSDNIVFFDVTGTGIKAPHLNVRVIQPKAGFQASGKRSTTAGSPSNPLFSNPLLFDLGVLFLELAYGAPFQSLLRPEDLEASPNRRYVDFLASRRLANEVGISLGAGFAAIVRRCLSWGSDWDVDLDDDALHTRLYKDVVCKLEQLEDGFRMLQLGA